MGHQAKKKTRSLSLDDAEWKRLTDRLAHHRLADRNEYIMSLVEADETLGFWVVLNEQKQKVLRPDPASIGMEAITTLPALAVAEGQTPYGGAPLKTPTAELIAPTPPAHTKAPGSAPRAGGKVPKTSRAPRV